MEIRPRLKLPLTYLSKPFIHSIGASQGEIQASPQLILWAQGLRYCCGVTSEGPPTNHQGT